MPRSGAGGSLPRKIRDSNGNIYPIIGDLDDGEILQISGGNIISGNVPPNSINIHDLIRPRIQTIKTSNAQDINTTSPVAITWDANDFITSAFTHTPGSADITVHETGTYLITFKINSVISNGNRRSPRVSMWVDTGGGFVENIQTRTICYTRNTTDNDGTNSLPIYEFNATDGDIFQIRGERSGSGGVQNTTLNECHIRIERFN